MIPKPKLRKRSAKKHEVFEEPESKESSVIESLIRELMQLDSVAQSPAMATRHSTEKKQKILSEQRELQKSILEQLVDREEES